MRLIRCLFAIAAVGAVPTRSGAAQRHVSRKALLQSVLAVQLPQLARADEEYGFRSTQAFTDTIGTGANQKLGFTERPNNLGSAGISAYQKMKINQALEDLAVPIAVAGASVKPTLEAYARLLSAIGAERLDLATEKAVRSVGVELASVSAGSEALSGMADSIGKKALAVSAAAGKKDASAAATAALKLSDEVTDFAYAFNGAAGDRPVVPKTAIGAPDLRAKPGATGAGAL